MKNRTDAPAAIDAGQFMLLVGGLCGQDVEVDEDYERRSFLIQGEIPPGGREEGR